MRWRGGVVRKKGRKWRLAESETWGVHSGRMDGH